MVPPTLFVSGAVAVMHVVKDIYERLQAVKRFRSDCEKLASLVQRIEAFLMETEDDAGMTAPGWEAAFSALHESLLEVVQVFDDCAKHGMIRSMINADELNLRLNSITQRLTLALQLIPIQKAKAADARMAELQAIQLEVRKATFSAVRAAEEQSAALKRLMDQSRVDASKTQEMLAQVMLMLKADARAAARSGGAESDGEGEPAAAARVDSSLLEAEVADLRAEMQQAVADKKQIEQQYLEQVIAAITAMESAQPVAPSAQPDTPAQRAAPSVPSDLLCPITLKLLEDPVILVDSAQTYERGAIQEWLDRGNRKDPVSGIQLVSTALVPNIAIRKMAQDWAQANPAYRQQQEEEDDTSAPQAALAHHASPQGSSSYDIGPFGDQGKLGGLQEMQSGSFGLHPATAAVLAAAASAPDLGPASSFKSFAACSSSQSFSATECRSSSAAAGVGVKHSQSMPAKGAGGKAGSSFGLGDLQAALGKSAATRERLAAAQESRGLFGSRSAGKHQAARGDAGCSGTGCSNGGSSTVQFLSSTEQAQRVSSLEGSSDEHSTGASLRKGSMSRGLLGALKSIKHSLVYDDSKV